MNSKEWRVVRNAYIEAHPLCELCQTKGFVVASRCVHHRTPVESGRTDAECWELALQVSNLMALCYQCHADIHKAERSRTPEGHKQREEERMMRWRQRYSRGES